MSGIRWIPAVLLAVSCLYTATEVPAIPWCDEFTCVSPCPICGTGGVFVVCSDCEGTRLCECRWTCQFNHRSEPYTCCCEPIWPDCPIGGCFLAGTPITMADGETKPIEAIREGDQVLAYDQSTGSMMAARVVRVHKPSTVDQYFIINGTIRVSTTQPVLSRGRWIEVGNLKVGDALSQPGGDSVTVVSLQSVEAKVFVHNLQVGVVGPDQA